MTNVTTQPPAANGQQPASQTPSVLEKSIADNVLSRIKVFEETGSINLPKDYSAPNALKAAWLILLETKTSKNNGEKPVLEMCTRESVANALLKMVVQGLNPVKRQCSFVAYGNQLTCQREYQGTIAIAKRDAGLVKIIANAVFKDDVFEYEIDAETGVKKVIKHTQTLDTMAGPVKGAYATKIYIDGSKVTEIMPMNQIQAAWRQGPSKGESPAHKNFPDQMAVKTVINRALKIDINSSDDSALLDDGDSDGDDVKAANVKYHIAQNSNKTEIGFPEEKPAEETPKVEQKENPVINQNDGGPGF
jgi:recombination protein RecT